MSILDPKWRIIGRVKNGWFASGFSEAGWPVSSSGGQLEPYTYWTGEKCDGYAKEAVNGAIVYDASECEWEDCIRVSIRGPLLDLQLKPWEYVPLFGETKLINTDAYFDIDSLKEQHGIGSLTKVSLTIWLKMMFKELPTAKWGYVNNGEVVWPEWKKGT